MDPDFNVKGPCFEAAGAKDEAIAVHESPICDTRRGLAIDHVETPILQLIRTSVSILEMLRRPRRRENYDIHRPIYSDSFRLSTREAGSYSVSRPGTRLEVL